MKKSLWFIVPILLALVAGCDLNIFDPDDDDDPHEGWIELAAYDFPVYVGHFADYEQTDAQGNSLGTVAYGEGGDDHDWQLLNYDPSGRSAMPKMAGKANGARDEYHILVQAFCEYNGFVELNAAIQFNGNDTGFITPQSFSYQGAYDPALEGSFLVSHPDYEFPFEPEVSFAPDTNTYSYVFQGMPIYIPPWDPFTAILDEQGHVLLRWTTWSETNMLGFRLHRSDTNDLANAQVINPELIPGTNTSEQHDYSYTDVNVSPGHNYYYWLEKVFDGFPSDFYGPWFILIPPAENSVSPAYPNPCQDYFRLPVEVKSGCTATVLVLDGQLAVRKSYPLEQQGYYPIYAHVHDLEPGLYRVFIWFHDGHYAYGDVLIED